MSEVEKKTGYNRPVPPEWEDWVAFSRSLLNPADPDQRTPEMAERMFGYLEVLDNGAIERNRFYSHGLVMDGMKEFLEDPDTRKRYVESVGNSLFRWWKGDGSTQRTTLQPRDVQDITAGWTFAHLGKDAARLLLPEVQLLSDALHVEESDRAAGIMMTLGKNPADQAESPVRKRSTEIKMGTAAEFVGKLAISGTVTVLRIILEKREPFVAAKKPAGSLEARYPTAVEIMDDIGDVSSLLAEIGERCAALRRDEFAHQVSNLIGATETGEVIFRRELMTPARRLECPVHTRNEAVVLHDKRLRCSSMFVPGLIPLMAEIVPAAVRYADQRAKRRTPVGNQ